LPRHLFIAEKPSLAGEVAQARGEQIGAKASRGQGYWSVGQDKVTWLFGHMYEQAPPDFYDERYKRWTIEDLPITPEKWALIAHKDKKDHIKIIKGLLKESDLVVNVGDAGREGQLLVDELLIENGWDAFSNKTKRLWVKSMARKDMLEALGGMFDNAEKKNLYNAAVCRQRADWTYGMNLSRLYTILARGTGANVTISVGRVQTPTLKLVVDRDREIENFKAVNHFLPEILFRHANGTFRALWVVPAEYEGLDPEGRLIDRKVAEKIVAKVSGKTGKVDSFKVDAKSKAPPLPYSLSALQKDCSAKFSLSAQQTLDVAQSLYEKKATTYPRSDSRHLPTSILKDEAPEIMKALRGTDELGEIASGANMGIKSAAWDDSKVSDHHGIIPTTEFSQSKMRELSDIERKVFMLIAKTFIAQFYPDQRWKAITALVGVEDEQFRATGRIPVEAGWTKVFGAADAEEESEDEDQKLPQMVNGDPVTAESGVIKDKKTTPPPRFTDGTLIEAMTQIHKFVKDPEIKKRLKENDGLGTEATRSGMIETLLRRTFMKRQGKFLVSTPVGRSVVDALPGEVTDPGLTAIWEGYLEEVNKGNLTPDKFMAAQITQIKKRIETGATGAVHIKGQSVDPVEGHGETCPVCQKGKMITRVVSKGDHKGKKFLSCNQYPDCKHSIWPDSGERKLIEPVEGHGKDCPGCGQGKLMTREIRQGEHKGKKFLSCDRYPDCKHSEWPKEAVDPIDGHGDSCPSCRQGKMRTQVVRQGDNKGKKYLSCDRYPDCKHSVWPKDVVDPLPGHDEDCPTCKQGKMKTRVARTGDNKGKRFLSCDRYPDCKHSVWPDDGTKKRSFGDRGGGSAGAEGGKVFGSKPSAPAARPTARPGSRRGS
jgi:DNA topoisomerase-3